MFWDESNERVSIEANTDIVDVLFSIKCRSLPIDHIAELSKAILAYAPWLSDVKGAGIHHIHVAESNNGWIRPHKSSDLLFPSKRTKLCIRIPKDYIAKITDCLCDKELDLSYEIYVGHSKTRQISPSEVLFSRHVIFDDDYSEDQFLNNIAKEINDCYQLDIKKMMCGKQNIITLNNIVITTIQVMLGGLDHETSVKIQQYGLGNKQLQGCGLFIPHKSINAVKTIK